MRVFLLCTLLLVPSAYARRAAPPVKEVIVKEGEVYQGVRFPAGTKLYVQVQGGAVTQATLSADFTMSGVKLLKGTTLEIFGDGKLFSFSPLEGQQCGGFTFRAGQAQTVTLDRDGKLSHIQLSAPMEAQGYRFGAGSQLRYAAGALEQGTYAAAQEKDGLSIAENSSLYFHPNGKLKQASIAKEGRVGEFSVAPDANPANPNHVELWGNGKLKSAILAKNAPVQELTCGPGRIAFFESGKLQSCTLGAPAKVSLNGYPKDAKAGDTLTLAENGRVVGWGGK